MANEEKLRDYLKRVTAELHQARRRLGEAEAARYEPVAVVGMACRYPGGVDSPEALWQLVTERRDATGDAPAERGWDLEGLYDPDPDHSGTTYTRRGGFLEGAGEFDAEFFGISPREATAMDPQQRLLLHTAWEAIENARIDPTTLRGTRTGVFTGVIAQDYAKHLGPGSSGDLEGYLVTGTTTSVASGRVSYTLGLEGPALTVDTACSSSLVAIHLAMQALRNEECTLALAGGATVMAGPNAFVEFSRQRGLAFDGRCKPFSDSADGFSLAEGAGLVLLERLSDAQRNGHRILAVLRGSAINQDGASSQLTAPSGPSQERVIRAALADARLTTADVDVIEAHGTGTPLGDPIEAQALQATYGAERDAQWPLRLGSIKSNIGHTQAGAGIAGVIKMVQALRHASVPATLHLDRPSSHVDWSSGAIALLDDAVAWPAGERTRRAGVSSFGISGTNAHLIVQEAPDPEPAPAEQQGSDLLVPVLLSARTEPGLVEQAARLRTFVERQPETSLPAIATALATTRTQFPHRLSIGTTNRTEVLAALESFAAGQPSPLAYQAIAPGETPRVVLVFPGQGAQWESMGRELFESVPVFTKAIRECHEALAPFTDWSLIDTLTQAPGAADTERVDVIQPLLWAMMIGLARLWQHQGLAPTAVIGHSQGEIAAAHIAGALTLQDSARIVALRSKAIRAITGIGGMLHAPVPAEHFDALLQEYPGVGIAAYNSPASTTLSGDTQALTALHEKLRGDDIDARMVPVDYASHSPHVDQLREQILADLADIKPQASTIPFYSTTRPAAAPTDTTTLDADYWLQNLRQPVRLQDVTTHLAKSGHRLFIEPSAHPVLTHAISDTADDATALGTLRRDQGSPRQFATALGQAHAHGARLVWSQTGPVADLPTYAFQTTYYWTKPTATRGDLTHAGLASADHPLLGSAIELPDSSLVFTGRLSLESHPWLADHAVADTVLLPGAAFVDVALHAGALADTPDVAELTLQAPLVLTAGQPVQLRLVLNAPDESGHRALTLHSRADDEDSVWTVHASGALSPSDDRAHVADLTDEPWPPTDAPPLDLSELYDTLAEHGYQYGPSFQGLAAVWQDGDSLYAEIELTDDHAKDATGSGIHPALLDAALHTVLAADLPGRDSSTPARLPFSWQGIRRYQAAGTAARARLTRIGEDRLSLLLTDADGNPILSVDRLVTRAVEPTGLGAASSGSLLEVSWIPLAYEADTAAPTLPLLTDVAALAAAEPRPGAVLFSVETAGPATDAIAQAHATAESVLLTLQTWLAEPRLEDVHLVVITHAATAVGPGDLPDLAQATATGLIRTAQNEHPGRITLLDLDDHPFSAAAVESVIASLAGEEPHIALRAGEVYVPRLERVTQKPSIVPPADASWRLGVSEPGSIDSLAAQPAPEWDAPLADGQVRVRLEAVGLNFRDVLIALGMYPEPTPHLGSEGAGTITEIGPGVQGFQVGDQVMGILTAGAGTLTVTDHRTLTAIPAGWSLAEAAGATIAYATAYYALVQLADLQPGERLLIHTATGGVGQAATHLARHLGARILATASVRKHHTLVSALGYPTEDIADSRSTDYLEHFLARTQRDGVDVVLHSLANEHTDSTLRLLPRGGRFIDMGKTDIRDAEAVAAEQPGVVYQAIDLNDNGVTGIARILAVLAPLFADGTLPPIPATSFPIEHAPQALRHLSQAQHTGKITLTLPAPSRPDGTTLITGGTGTLAGLTALHLAEHHGHRHFTLVSRSGPDAPDAERLTRQLTDLGAEVQVVAADTSDAEQVRAVLDGVPSDHPITTIVHAAGALHDVAISALTAEQLHSVLTPKLDTAHLLHTADLPHLKQLIFYSSAAAALANPGQAAYNAANTYLDALAHHRTDAVSVGWGLWQESSALTQNLTAADHQRLRAQGLAALATEDALRLLDESITEGGRHHLALGFDSRALSRLSPLPPLLRDLAPQRRSSASAPGRRANRSLRQALVRQTPDEQLQTLLNLVRAQAAAVLGHAAGADAIPADSAFRDLGFDSLTSVELRNVLGTATGLRLSSTVIFDYPTPARLAGRLHEELELTAQPTARTNRSARRAKTRNADEPIAIVGMACRFPGGVDSPEKLWELLTAGRDATGTVPAGRGWDLDEFYDADPDRPGTSYTRRGGFLHDAGEFDAEFFGINPREATAMDPQQRLLLHTAWEAVEHANIDPTTLRGSRTGVFTGVVAQNYAAQLDARSAADLEGYLVTGTTMSVASGRVAYTLGLEGPALTVDTACSSSLVSIHLAMQALRNDECELALAGGATVMATPSPFIEFSRQRGLAPDGRCKPFSDRADGFALSEGAGLVVLERLSDARRNGHQVLALIRGSAVNQDGASNGLTAPNGPSQERVIRAALASAGVSAGDVDVVEAHGTGTTLGDPIEAQALLATYGAEREAERPLLLGSIKSNIGHTQAAAGIAGVIKMVLALRQGSVPATLHLDRASAHVDWSAGTVVPAADATAWPEVERPRRAGVSSFGISGTNAHLILEQAPEVESAARQAPDVPIPVLLAARSRPALAAQAARLAAQLRSQPEVAIPAVAAGLATARTRFQHRLAVSTDDRQELLSALEQVAADEPAAAAYQATASTETPRTVLVFPGQGAQWEGMGRELFESVPVFTEAIRACHEALAPFTDWSLIDTLTQTADAADTERVDVIQPLLWAMMIGLTRLWQHHGLAPAAAIGHSQGEIAAAHIAGALTLEDSARIVALRSKAIRAIAGTGGMLHAPLPAEKLAPMLEQFPGVGIAAYNSPASTTLSGDIQTLTALHEALQRDDIDARMVPVDYASHSPHIDQLREQILAELADIKPQPATIPFYSTTRPATASPTDTTALDASYWFENLREPVRLQEATEQLAASGHRLFIEPSAHPVLAQAISDTDDRLTALGSLRRGQDSPLQFSTALGRAHVHGAALTWPATIPAADLPTLPTYPFQSTHYWYKPSAAGSADPAGLGQTAAEHPLLGSTVELPDGSLVVTGRLSMGDQPWLADHAVAGTVLLPGTAFIELALHIGALADVPVVEDLTLQAPLVLTESQALQLSITLSAAEGSGRRALALHTRPEAEPDSAWTCHATGTLAIGDAADDADRSDVASPPTDAEPLDLSELYDSLADHGYEYGPAFQNLTAAWQDGDHLYARLELAEDQAETADAYTVHPALLDSALHTLLAASPPSGSTSTRLPFSWRGVTARAAAGAVAQARLTRTGDDSLSLKLTDSAGRLVLSIAELTTRIVDASRVAALGRSPIDGLYRQEWVALAASLTEPARDESVYYWLPATQSAPDSTELIAEAHATTEQALLRLQDWLSDADRHDAHLVVVAQSADLVHATVAGLVRTAQSEHPGRITLVDMEINAGDATANTESVTATALAAAQAADSPSTPTTEIATADTDAASASASAIARAVAAARTADEPYIAVREGAVFVPRLARGVPVQSAVAPPPPGGTTFITGGTGTLAGLTALHLAEHHGQRRFLLASRSGPDAPGAADLVRRLGELGAEARVVAADTADPVQLRALLSAEPSITTVVHTAGALHDATFSALTPDQLHSVLTPKLDTALLLHTADLPDLRQLILFSSAAATLANPGQAAYNAASSFLDALARQRPNTVSVGWGLWQETSGLTQNLTAVDQQRLRGSGVLPLATERALALLDSALASEEPHLLAVDLDITALSSLTPAPALVRGLVRKPRRRTASADAARVSLGDLSPQEQQEHVTRLVPATVAAVLGHADPTVVDTDRPFKDLGFDSLTGVELRNRLEAATGIRMPATLVFDRPTPAAVTAFVLETLTQARPGPGDRLFAELDRVDAAVAVLNGSEPTVRDQALARVRGILRALEGHGHSDSVLTPPDASDIQTAAAEDLLELIDREFDLGGPL